MSIDLGEASMTINFSNKATKELEKVEKKTQDIITKGEKIKQKEVDRTTGFFQRQGRAINNMVGKVGSFTGNLATSFAGMGAMATVGAIGINKLISSSYDFAQAQLKAEAVAGTSTVAIQKLSNVYSNLANIDIGQATSELSSFAQKIERAKMGFESPVALMMGGVNFNERTTLDSAIKDLRRNLGGRSTQEISTFLEQAGLSNDLLFVIKASSQELEKFNSIPVLSKKQLQEIQGAGKSLGMLKKLISGLVKTSQAQIAPYLRVELERLFTVFAKNKTQIVDFISNTTKWIGRFVTATIRATGLVWNFITSLMDSKTAFITVGSAIGLLLFKAHPLKVALVGIIALLEDIAVWRDSGQSKFASFYEGVSKLYNMLDTTLGGVNLLNVALIGLGGASVLRSLGLLSGALKGIGATLSFIGKNPIMLGLTAVAGVGAFAYNKFKKGKNDDEKMQEAMKVAPEKFIAGVQQPNLMPNSLPSRNSTLNQNQSMINNNQQLTFNIDGGKSKPTDIAKEIGIELERSFDFDMSRLNSLTPTI